MRAFGAELHIVPSKGGQVTPDLVPRMIEAAEKLAESDEVYFTNQLYNSDSLLGYERIGREILQQVDGSIDLYCGAVGTAGMLMGVSRVLKEVHPQVRIVAFEPASSAVISTGEAGTHHVEGIGIGFIPPLLEEEAYDEARGVEEAEGREMARRLAREEGIFVGTSSGLNVAGAVQLAQELGPGKNVVTVACDSGLKYLSGDLYE
jgi:cysteine synthase